eukprot:TRINITY_DN1442_c5_g1_i1.p1 TRINITY_DN1442_c5_g1~~TRINITY_DN1442_c5_g1_i1.p1  ORF type:complete len:839 (+),score=398.05 TRINITY_DN1442_c5_g1_i1:150-2519(+)
MAGISRKSAKSLKGGLDPGAKDKRIQQQKARAGTKRDAVLWQKRLGRKGAPKIVGFIPVGEVSDQALARRQLQEACDPTASTEGVQHVRSEQFRQTFTFLHSTDNQQEQLDLAKVADVLVIAIRVNSDEDVDPNTIEPDLPDDQKSFQTWFSDIGLCIDDSGRQLLSTINCQGLPSVCVVLQGLNLIASAKKRRQVERVHLRYFQSIMTADVVPKVFSMDTPEKTSVALRYISEQRLRPLKWRDMKPYMLIDACRWAEPEAAPYTNETDGTPCKTLSISGFLRGKGLSANQLIHLTGYGTYQIEKIADREGNVLSIPDEGQESLQFCQVPDPMEGEQTWPTEEELKEAERKTRNKDRQVKKMKVKVPKGFSDYQAAWVADPAEFEEISDTELDHDLNAMETKSRATTRHSRVSTAQQTDVEEVMGGDWLAQDEAMTLEERQAELARLKEASTDDRDFPDEVETPMHIPSRIRFQKYRGLPSFRSSTWDPNESLPIDYARIFKFENFKRAQKLSVATPDGKVVESDTYVTVTLKNVPLAFLEVLEPRLDAPLIASGLLKHEQKYSVLHFRMQRNKEYDEPIKSKTRLVIHLGFRKVVANPTYSDVCKGTRTKFCRYFHADDKFIMMSMYGPTSFLPTPALCFQPITRAEKEEGAEMPFVSFGAAETPNPDLLLLKKIVLTGHVYKTHKRQCIVRFMFHNEDDVKWFQPVELYTKLGFRGRILKSVGTHGHMKATFSGIVQGHDVVCMDLWKRVFPKWTTAAFSHLATTQQDEASDDEESEEDEAMAGDDM